MKWPREKLWKAQYAFSTAGRSPPTTQNQSEAYDGGRGEDTLGLPPVVNEWN